MTKTSGGNMLNSFVNSVFGTSAQASPSGVPENLQGAELSGGRKSRGRKPAAKKPVAKKPAAKKPVAKKSVAKKPAAKTAKRSFRMKKIKIPVITRGGHNIAPLLTSLIALGLRIAHGDTLKKRGRKGGDGSCSTKLSGGGIPSLEHFVNSLQFETFENAPVPSATLSNQLDSKAPIGGETYFEYNAFGDNTVKYQALNDSAAILQGDNTLVNAYKADNNIRGGRSRRPRASPKSGKRRSASPKRSHRTRRGGWDIVSNTERPAFIDEKIVLPGTAIDESKLPNVQAYPTKSYTDIIKEQGYQGGKSRSRKRSSSPSRKPRTNRKRRGGEPVPITDALNTEENQKEYLVDKADDIPDDKSEENTEANPKDNPEDNPSGQEGGRRGRTARRSAAKATKSTKTPKASKGRKRSSSPKRRGGNNDQEGGKLKRGRKPSAKKSKQSNK